MLRSRLSLVALALAVALCHCAPFNDQWLMPELRLTQADSGGTCPDLQPKGYYADGTTWVAGIPDGYAGFSSGMTACELNDLNAYCVEELNNYRAHKYKFSDGRERWAAEGTISALSTPNNPALQCHNTMALSDLKIFNDGAGCGHPTSNLKCEDHYGIKGPGRTENSCCTRSCTTLDQCKSTLKGCLQAMYDEGEIVLDTGSGWSEETGHYYNMVGNSAFATCGFGFDSNNQVVMTQKFMGNTVGSAENCQYQCNSASNDCGTCIGSPVLSTPTPEPTTAAPVATKFQCCGKNQWRKKKTCSRKKAFCQEDKTTCKRNKTCRGFWLRAPAAPTKAPTRHPTRHPTPVVTFPQHPTSPLTRRRRYTPPTRAPTAKPPTRAPTTSPSEPTPEPTTAAPVATKFQCCGKNQWRKKKTCSRKKAFCQEDKTTCKRNKTCNGFWLNV